MDDVVDDHQRPLLPINLKAPVLVLMYPLRTKYRDGGRVVIVAEGETAPTSVRSRRGADVCGIE